MSTVGFTFFFFLLAVAFFAFAGCPGFGPSMRVHASLASRCLCALDNRSWVVSIDAEVSAFAAAVGVAVGTWVDCDTDGFFGQSRLFVPVLPRSSVSFFHSLRFAATL